MQYCKNKNHVINCSQQKSPENKNACPRFAWNRGLFKIRGAAFMRRILYWVWQCTWGCLQSILGLLVFLVHIRDKHFLYHGAVITQWNGQSSVSLGLFVFVTNKPYFYEKLKDRYTLEDLSQRLLVHEYGHTIQSLILGPLYLIVMGIPSTLWGFLPSLSRKRKKSGLSYFSFFTEKWANQLGEKVTGQKSMENLCID